LCKVSKNTLTNKLFGGKKISQALLLDFVWKVGEDALSLRHELLMQRYEEDSNNDGTDVLGGFERKGSDFW